ncbi:hypothetical protein Bca52824_011089 [Brassica carinata]|uniref:Uncharacterized protein n=1 Tax=Brassica carinata TaxID=52824 RepID=A0A8X7WF45_BRACI|nr:hypothetical protein Bca52824_011089 [Brassica carinata]
MSPEFSPPSPHVLLLSGLPTSLISSISAGTHFTLLHLMVSMGTRQGLPSNGTQGFFLAKELQKIVNLRILILVFPNSMNFIHASRTQRLVTSHKSIWFEDLYNQDVAARKEELNVDFPEEPAREGVMNKDEEEDNISLRTLIEEGLKNSVNKGIKVVIDKVDDLDKRLRKVEAFLKEAKEKSAITRVEEPSLVEQESEEVALASTANGEATRKRKASDDVIHNMCG